MVLSRSVEVIIVGKSFSGLSAALVLGRSLRKVLVVGFGDSRNHVSEGAHNVLGREGDKPFDLLKKGEEEILAFEHVEVLNDTVVGVEGSDGEFRVKTMGNGVFQSKKVILATGVTDILPEIDGAEELWGKYIFHCPYCHGYEVANQPLCLYAEKDEHLSELSWLISNWSKDLVVLTNGREIQNKEALDRIKELGLKVETKKISSLKEETKGKKLTVCFEDGDVTEFAGMFIRAKCKQRATFVKDIGCEMDEAGLFVKIDPFHKTSLKGLFAVGDMTTFLQSVTFAMADGLRAGVMVNMELLKE